MYALVLSTAIVAYFGAIARATICGSRPSYPVQGPQAVIPLSNDASDATERFPNAPPLIRFNVTTQWAESSYHFNTAVDTGSTGIALSAVEIGLEGQDFDTSRPGKEYLSSSRRLWEGFWIDSQVAFEGDVLAEVPVLAVTNSSICAPGHWNGTEGTCSLKTNYQPWPDGIAYVGIGFGRWSNEQKQACPDKVPFINIKQIAGVDVSGSIHQGYILSESDITVGLNTANTGCFAMARLGRMADSTCEGLGVNWQMVGMSISIDDSAVVNQGLALLDTGIAQSYITVENDIYQSLKFASGNLLRDGSIVTALIGDQERVVANYTVVVSGSSALEAAGYHVSKWHPNLSHGPFINTGRHVYNGYCTVFDAECGFFGLLDKAACTPSAELNMEL